jgi:hypothetical protein
MLLFPHLDDWAHGQRITIDPNQLWQRLAKMNDADLLRFPCRQRIARSSLSGFVRVAEQLAFNLTRSVPKQPTEFWAAKVTVCLVDTT